MIRCLFIQGMTDYWLWRQPWKNSTKELALPYWMMWFPPKILLFPRNDLLWEWRKVVFLPWETGSCGCRGLEPQELAGSWAGLSWGLSLPSSRPSIPGPCLSPFFGAWEKDWLAQEGNFLPRKSCVQGLPPELHCCVHPTDGTLNAWSLHLGILPCKHTLYPVSLPLLGSSEFTAGPGGEFSSRCPNNETFP